MLKIFGKIDLFGRWVDVIDIYPLVLDRLGWFENCNQWIPTYAVRWRRKFQVDVPVVLSCGMKPKKLGVAR
jgi:hypothetical protein